MAFLTAALFAASAVAQFVPAPTDLISAEGYAGFNVRYKQVPTGICEQDPNVKSYAGYVDVAPDQHIFWWFFEARNQDPSTAPLTTWINGGPGSSSMIGLFQELGPCGVDSAGNVYNNPYSWSNASNMLFIDQPTQVGFSYSVPVPGYVDASTQDVVTLPNNTCPDYAQGLGCGTYSYPNETLTANSTDAAAPNFWATLQGFMGAFPQYSRESYHFATESYGGHYGPVFNEYIEAQNAKNISGAHRIKLESVLIGNGWYDPLLQYIAYYNFTVYPGNTYDYSPYNASIQAQLYNNLFGTGNCVDQIEDCYTIGTNAVCSAADTFCANLVEAVYDNVLNRDEYDIRELMPDPFPYTFYVDYLNTAKVQSAIGAYQNFSEFSNAVGNDFGNTGDDGREEGTVEDVKKLLQQGVTVMMYAGDADYNCNWLGGEAVANEVGQHGFATAGYVNISTSDAVTHGQVKQSGAFSFVRIFESGHEVPFYQPLVSLEIFERAIRDLDIATGETKVTSSYQTVGPSSTQSSQDHVIDGSAYTWLPNFLSFAKTSAADSEQFPENDSDARGASYEGDNRMFFTPRTYQQLQNLEQDSKRAGDHYYQPAVGWRISPVEIRRSQEMLLVHQTGSVKIGEVVRYTLTYTPSHDRILPSPSQLYVKIKNTSAIVLRGAYLHGPYALYAASYPSTFKPNYRREDPEQHGAPDFEPNLKAGGSWISCLKVPENIRESAGKVNAKRTTDGGVPSCTWIIEVSSQVLFSVTATVDFEILVGRDDKSIELGFSALTGQGTPVAGQLQDHQQGRGKSRHSAAQPKGVFSKAINLVVDDTASLWNRPALPEWNDEKKESAKDLDPQETKNDAHEAKRISSEPRTEDESLHEEPTARKRKNVHLVVLTHGLHSNLGADMLYLKESIDAAAKEAREDARKRKAELRRQGAKNNGSNHDHGKENHDVPRNRPGTSTAQFFGGQDDTGSGIGEDEEEYEEVIVRGFSGNAVRTERGIQYLGKRLAKYVLSMTYPDQPFLPVKKSMTKSLSRAFTGSHSSDVHAGLPAHKDSSIHRGIRKPSNPAYKITSISFIAHSLGGLTQTYAIAYIHKHSPHFFEEIKPINFVTMATPFLGLSNENPMYVKFALDFGLVGRTGQDLGLTWRAPTMVRSGWGAMIGGIGAEGQRAQKNPDPQAKPLLRVLPTGPAHQVLKLFRNRTVYSNVVNDGIVPLRTSCLLFLDWRGLGRVEKARRENGLIGTMAGWGWAEFTGVNSTERQHRGFDSGADSQADSDADGSRSTSKSRQHQTSVPQPAEDATKNDTTTQGEDDTKTHHVVKRPTERFEDEEYDTAISKNESPAQPANPFSSLLNYLRPSQTRSHHHSPKQTKIYKRSQTVKGEAGDGAGSSEDATTNRPGMARGESVLDDDNGFAPPKTTFFESAGDILNPPLPSKEFLIDPASRPRTIFHDRIYHPEDIPPPPTKQRSSIKRTFSSDGSRKPLNRVDTEYGAAAPQSQPDTGGMKVEEKIARAYHHDLSWRKVLVRLEPDAHNNICVRRMFSNAYGWPVVKHLVDTHFSSDYSAVTADENEPSTERAKPIDDPVGKHGEEVKDEIPKPVGRTDSEVREAKDDLGALKSGQGSSLSSPVSGRKKLERQDSAMWDDAMFEVTDDDEDEEIDANLSPRDRRQLLKSHKDRDLRHKGTTEAEIADFLRAEPKRQPEGLNIPRQSEAAAQPPVTGSPLEEHKVSVTPKGGTTGIGLGKSVQEQLSSPGSQKKKGAQGEEQQQGILRDMTKMSMYDVGY